MKRNKIISIITAVAFAAVVLPGCSKFLDVNTNPNATENVEPKRVLPSIEAGIAHVVSYQYQTQGNFWSQYWTQFPTASQFRSIDAYSSGPSDFDRPWAILYAGALADTDSLIAQQGVPKFKQYAGIAWLLRAYAFQLLTDGFGDIPLKDALHGTGNRNPTYDPQKAVYDSIFLWIDRGNALLDPAAPAAFLPGTEDVLTGGGVAGINLWKRFANTLKLRAYMRLSEVDPAKAATGIRALYTANATFLVTDFDMKWTSTGGNNNPLWAEVVSLAVRNQAASATIVDAYNRNTDPRLKQLFTPLDGDIYAIPQGSFNRFGEDDPVSNPSARVLGAVAPGRLIGAAESFFLQAEAVSRGWTNGTGNAQTLFTSGIRASFVTFGLTATDADTYAAAAPDALWSANPVEQLRLIITQKYYAMCGSQGFEAWCEYRRTGLPDILIKSEASVLGTNNKPARLIYPQAELTRNSNFPGVKKIDERVWWDIK